jgi:hypothetical protein
MARPRPSLTALQQRIADRITGTITLERTPEGWYYDVAGTSKADQLRGLCGGTRLLSSYHATADATVVLSALRQLNPGCTVVLLHEVDAWPFVRSEQIRPITPSPDTPR